MLKLYRSYRTLLIRYKTKKLYTKMQNKLRFSLSRKVRFWFLLQINPEVSIMYVFISILCPNWFPTFPHTFLFVALYKTYYPNIFLLVSVLTSFCRKSRILHNWNCHASGIGCKIKTWFNSELLKLVLRTVTVFKVFFLFF